MAPLGASTIDVSGDTSVILHTGDELLFQLSVQSYQRQAAVYGAPVDPTTFSFILASEPVASRVQFEAGLQATDGGASETFPGPLSLAPGILTSSTYSGPVSTLTGSLALSQSESWSLFRSGAAVLYLEDLGGEVTLGLPPYDLRQDLYGSTAGGPISVGAITTGVSLARSPGSQVPEPTSALLVLGGAALCLAAQILKRLRHGVSDRKAHFAPKLVCNRLSVSGTIYVATDSPLEVPPIQPTEQIIN